MKPTSKGVTTSELVILALHKFEAENPELQGCTPDRLIQCILESYNANPEGMVASVHAALYRGLTFGVFSQNNGRFRLEDIPEPPLEENPPMRKPVMEKIGAIIVEAGSEATSAASGTKRRKVGDLQMNETTQPWIDDEEENWNCQLAKRKREKSRGDGELSEEITKRFMPSLN